MVPGQRGNEERAVVKWEASIAKSGDKFKETIAARRTLFTFPPSDNEGRLPFRGTCKIAKSSGVQLYSR